MPDKDAAFKDVAVKAKEFLEALDIVDVMLDDKDKDKLKDLVSRPIGLRDTGGFYFPITVINRDEIREARRELSSAIIAEKWAEGFVTAVRIISVLGG